MQNKYPLLSKIIQNEFSYEMEISRDEGINFLMENIKKEHYNIDLIREEYEEALSDDSFRWVEFAVDNKLLWDRDSYSNHDVINYLKFYFNEVVHPQTKFTSMKRKQFLEQSLEILEHINNSDDGWIRLEILYREIISKSTFKSLPYYKMYYLLIHSQYKIKGRTERGRGKEIIFVKYNN